MTTTLLVVLLIGSTLLLATAAIVIHLMPRSSAASRFSIWQIAVTSLLLLPLGVLFLPEVPLGFVSKTSRVPFWQFEPCSDRLLIDHEGVIRRRAMYGTDLDETIEQLVENAERK